MVTKEIISALDQYNENWREVVETTKDPKLVHMISILCDSVLNDIRSDFVFLEKDAEKYWNSKEVKGFFDKNVKNFISKRIETELNLSIDLQYLRAAGSKIGYILEEIVNNMIVRYDPEFVSEFENFGFKNRNEFIRMCQALTNIFFTHTARTYTMNAAKKDFEEITGLKTPYSDVYALLFEKSYKEIQIQHLVNYVWSK